MPNINVEFELSIDDKMLPLASLAEFITEQDVEGAEPLVIDSLKTTLSAVDYRDLYCEIHLDDVPHQPSIHDFDTNMADIRSQLEGYGFAVEEV